MPKQSLPTSELTREEMDNLVQKYFDKDGYAFPRDFEHRYEERSSAQCYSLIRLFKPTSVLEFGTSYGGATCIILKALLKNKKPFKFVTSELVDDIRRKAKENIKRTIGRLPKMVGKIEDNLDKVPKVLDFVFIDTDHDIENTKWYLENIIPRVKKGGLIAIHDWPVEETEDGLKTKHGVWAETTLLMDLHQNGKLPFRKLYWNWEEGEGREGSFWVKI